jgi:hypothetical protein
MAVEYMLTTIDNPYDPFVEFDSWYQYDEAQGYHSTSYLARIVQSSYDISEADQLLAIERAIDEIVEENILGIYQKVSRETS